MRKLLVSTTALSVAFSPLGTVPSFGQVLNDKPAAGGFDAKAFQAATDPWKQTLESYEKIFGAAPPMDIWGKPAAQANPFDEMMRNYRKMWGME